ncbi:guanine nucleotide exchange factor C9orf72-like [Dreissena polymorpha]|uniref:guanine nucleotide exchange factor C9orf72-like n=1 Tax=Dreissena polymorpha TaxID=45954 RepID=UPI0022651A5B|nr:guanine nucleotide exchange factor C9orf72-like [Dreissena polymorpha]XP_052256927.1 guanine nucleotide exchange factor C9orf72-like [Dreissena polymorpha]
MSKEKSSLLLKRESADLGVLSVNTDLSDVTFYAITPSSPSSKFTKSGLDQVNPATCPFRGVVLSFWDNILGPRTRHVWNANRDNPLSSDLLSHITSQVLSCEICRDPYKCDIDFKFYNLPHKGVVVPAFVFSAKGTHGMSVHSLYVVIPNTELEFYLEIHETLLSCFQRLTRKLRVILEKNPFDVSVDVFKKYLSDCVRTLSLLHNTSLATNIELADTVFCRGHARALDNEFLARCIASHLMTFGRSLVLGDTPEKINLVLNTLCMFNSESERRCSLPFCVKDPQAYHHDIYLQGLLKGSDSSFLPMTELLVSSYPTTIIDLTSRDVRQMQNYSEHAFQRFATLKNELICLQYGNFEELLVQDQDLINSSVFPDTLVQTLVKEIFELPGSCCVQAAYIAQFMRILHKRAQCLIESVRAESNEGQVLVKSNILRKIRLDLQLNAEGDFLIVLATAEKLKPGLYTFLKPHRSLDRDFKNIDMYSTKV